MNKVFTKSIIAAAALVLASSNVAYAQDAANSGSDWYFGVGGGYRLTHMGFSDINEDLFPENEWGGSGVYSFFVQGEFGRERNFAVRPQLSFLDRGGKLTGIGRDLWTDDMNDVWYKLNAHYIDIRVPLIYNFGKAEAAVRPYIYVAPVLGFVTGGEIEMLSEYEDCSVEGYRMDLSDANMSSTYFAAQLGVGVKFRIPVASDYCYLGVEAAYEYGFTDTYGGKEKDGDANDVAQLFNANYAISGSRKFQGIEFQATLSVPFSIFKQKAAPAPQPVVAAPAPQPEPVVEEKPCYTLDEIIELMAKNESIEGKTICAVDAINFDFSKSTIKSESYEYLDKLAATLIRSNRRIEVKGHTDNVGSEEFNMNLSRERAEAVVDYLVSKGVDRNKLTYSYYGMSRPLSDNDTEEGRAMNRRVEFTILNNF